MDWVHFGSNFICQPCGGQTVRIIFLLNFLYFEASKAACLLSNFQKSLCFKTCIYTLLSINLFILFGTSKPPKDLEQKDNKAKHCSFLIGCQIGPGTYRNWCLLEPLSCRLMNYKTKTQKDNVTFLPNMPRNKKAKSFLLFFPSFFA